MTTIDIPITALRAAMLFAAKQDVRYYLNGLHIVLKGDGTGEIQATDGHRAIVIRLLYVPAVSLSVIIPATLVETLLKAKGCKKANYAFLDIPANEKNNRDAPFTLREPLYSGAAVAGQTIDGVFPDMQKVVPKKCSNEIAQYNWQYMADCQDAAEILTGSGGEGAPVAYNGDGPAIVYLSEDAFALVMPCRKGEVSMNPPEWYSIESGT